MKIGTKVKINTEKTRIHRPFELGEIVKIQPSGKYVNVIWLKKDNLETWKGMSEDSQLKLSIEICYDIIFLKELE